MSWFYPNRTLMIPFGVDDPEANTKFMEVWKDPNVKYSASMGFVFDDTKVKDQTAACSGIVQEYRKALLFGQVDVEEYNKKFTEELKANGIDDILTEMNAQFKEFQK